MRVAWCELFRVEELFGQDAYYGLVAAARLGCAMGGAQWLIESLQPKPDAAEDEVKRLDEHMRSLAVAAEAVGEAEAATTPRDVLIPAMWKQLKPRADQAWASHDMFRLVVLYVEGHRQDVQLCEAVGLIGILQCVMSHFFHFGIAGEARSCGGRSG